MKGPKYVDTNISSAINHEKNYEKHLKKLQSIQHKKYNLDYEHMKLLEDRRQHHHSVSKFKENGDSAFFLVISLTNFQHTNTLTERNQIIQKNNNILLMHLADISAKSGMKLRLGLNCEAITQDSAKIQFFSNNGPKSLNLRNRKIEQHKIAFENSIIARKLIEKQPIISSKNLSAHSETAKKLAHRIRKFHYDLNNNLVVRNIESNRQILNKVKLPALDLPSNHGDKLSKRLDKTNDDDDKNIHKTQSFDASLFHHERSYKINKPYNLDELLNNSELDNSQSQILGKNILNYSLMDNSIQTSQEKKRIQQIYLFS